MCDALVEIIDHDGGSDEDLLADERSAKLADAVLAKVVALNASGDWRRARELFDPAHAPFIPHMERTTLGLTSVSILGPDSFLVRRGRAGQTGVHVLHIDGDVVRRVEDVYAFARSRSRQWLVLAKREGLVVAPTLRAAPHRVVPWPEASIDAKMIVTLDVANDGSSIALASDAAGIWLVRGTAWTRLAPLPETRPKGRAAQGGRPDAAGAGTYGQLAAVMTGKLGIDRTHAAISPDGKHVAYGWQDAEGHYVDRIEAGAVVRVGVVAPESDYPYHVRFTDDSQQLVSNSRRMESGVTVCVPLASIGKTKPGRASTDHYLRAYGMTFLPGELFGLEEPVVWIGGAGWSHAAPLRGGKPVFTQFLGSPLRAFDYDPSSKRVIVASESGFLHLFEPAQPAASGRERGYRPRREIYRWVFWDTLESPIRW